jgi:hypothetical protein
LLISSATNLLVAIAALVASTAPRNSASVEERQTEVILADFHATRLLARKVA